MTIKRALCWALVGGALTLSAPGAARAGPYLGEWDWCWHEKCDCPKGHYHWLHYWAPVVYRVAYGLHPRYIDQYAPGLPVPVGWLTQPSPCRAVLPYPAPPYADPAGFYGRQIIPPPVPVGGEKDREKLAPADGTPAPGGKDGPGEGKKMDGNGKEKP